MEKICPFCKTSNKIELDFRVDEYICSSCAKLVDTAKNTAGKVVRKPKEHVVLEIGQKGIIENNEYTVTSIVVRKYGTATFWREYILKSSVAKNLYLSEANGHWVLLEEINITFDSRKKSVLYDGLLYRQYETTPNLIDSATGFFEDKINFTSATYVEYVFGSKMISCEHHGSRKEFFSGKHISFSEIKKIFKIDKKPDRYGVGIVQPFYINIRQLLNIFAVTTILIAVLQLVQILTRSNYEVFNDVIRFDAVIDKEIVTKSFLLNGGSAPMNVDLFSNVDNSWANVELSLVNESTNEITYTSKDIERYSGVEDGESWSEGSTKENFNFCGVAPGKYHFIISAQKQGLEKPGSGQQISNVGGKTITKESDGLISVKDNTTGNIITYGDEKTFKKDSINLSLTNSLNDSLKISNTLDIDTTNPNFEVHAYWQPVTMWNFGISVVIMACIIGLAFWAKSIFEKSKWSDSNNSPYSN